MVTTHQETIQVVALNHPEYADGDEPTLKWLDDQALEMARDTFRNRFPNELDSTTFEITSRQFVKQARYYEGDEPADGYVYRFKTTTGG